MLLHSSRRLALLIVLLAFTPAVFANEDDGITIEQELALEAALHSAAPVPEETETTATQSDNRKQNTLQPEPERVRAQQGSPGNTTKPHWTIEIKASRFEPELDDWQRFYGDDHSNQFGLAFAYKILRQLEIGLATDRFKEDGVGNLPLNNRTGGQVEYEQQTRHLFVLYRAIFNEQQIFVPYIGAGISEASYKQTILNQDEVEGDADGHHWRLGLQILLDKTEVSSASNLNEESGIDNSYFIIELQETDIEIDNIPLGGTALSIGFTFEF